MALDLTGPVPERDFLTGHRAVIADHDQHGGERSIERTLGILCGLFPRKSGKPARIMIRMQALASVWDHPLMKAWKTEGLPEGGMLIEETIFKVAARHPLYRSESDFGFDPHSFFAAVLKRAKRQGNG